MSHKNLFVVIREEIESQFDQAADDFRQWTWKDDTPPRHRVVELIEQYKTRVTQENLQHEHRPSVVRKRAASLRRWADKIQTTLPPPLSESSEFIEAWIEANETHPSALYLLQREALHEELARLIRACDKLASKSQTDQRKNTGAHDRWLAVALHQVFIEHVAPTQATQKQAADFIGETGRIFSLPLLETDRALRQARKEILG